MTAQRVVVGSGGVALAVTEWGTAESGQPTVVLVHGYPDTSTMWQPVAELLAPRYHVVAYDVRGAGRSGAPAETDDYRIDKLVEDMAAVVDATCPDRPIHLVGHDWGSIQGWEAVSSARLAGRIASFTSLYAPGLDHAGAWFGERLRHPTPHHLRQLLGQQRRSWYIVAFHLPGAQAAWRGGLGRAWPGVQRKREHVPASESYPAATVQADGAQGIALYRANFLTHFGRPDPRPTTVPTQVIVATKDHYVSPAMSEGLQRWAPTLWRSEVVAGHWLPRTHPNLVATYVTELVDHIEGGPETPRLRRARVHGPAGPAGPGGHQQSPAGPGGHQQSPAGPGGHQQSPAGPGGHQQSLAGPDRGPGDRGKRTGHDRLRNRVVVVTGAGGGIGRATALAFAAEGATIVAADIDPEGAAGTAARAAALGVESHARTVDVADAEAMEGLAKWVEHTFGAPDVVVNNAGIGLAGPLLDTTVSDWERVLGVNLWGVIHGSRLFGRLMADAGQGGHIVNVASAAAFTPSRSYPAYATSKAGVLMLTECLRAELADAGIGVHAICPGLVDTAISVSTRHVGVNRAEEDTRRQAMVRFYGKRGLTADQVAKAVLAAVRSGRAVVAVGPEARMGRALSRLSPAASRRLARVDLVARFT